MIRGMLYDYTGKEINIEDKEIVWSLSNENYIEFGSVENSRVEIKLKDELSQVPSDNYTILKATLKEWGDYDLEAYLPLPIRLSKDY
jgi:hypothetical protein